MKTILMVALALMAAASLRAGSEKVTVCVEPSMLGATLGRAQDLASRMYAEIGVVIDWRRDSPCPPEAIVVTGSDRTPDTLFPGSMAHATPFQSRIQLFVDRIQAATPRTTPAILAYLLVHQLGHVLQGMYRHSTSGVMKARWEEADYEQIARTTLEFTPEDIRLIHSGLARRARRLATQADN